MPISTILDTTQTQIAIVSLVRTIGTTHVVDTTSVVTAVSSNPASCSVFPMLGNNRRFRIEAYSPGAVTLLFKGPGNSVDQVNVLVVLPAFSLTVGLAPPV